VDIRYAVTSLIQGSAEHIYYQGSEMLTHQALGMLKRRTGLTKAR
jgi:hypothetical protein